MVERKLGPAPFYGPVAAGVVILVVALVFGWGLYGGALTDSAGADPVIDAARAVPAQPAPVAGSRPQSSAAQPMPTQPARIVRGDGRVDFHFARDSAILPVDAQRALADIVKGVAIGKSAVISVHDGATDTPEERAVLAGQRTTAVRAALMDLGIGADKLITRRPADGDDTGVATAGWVEVSLEE